MVGFLACLLAIVVLIILIWPPSPVGVVLVGADYADNLMVPHNILGWKGIEGIEAVAKTPRLWALFKPAALHLMRPPQILDQPERWDALIDDLVKTGFKQQTILIVLGLHGGSDPDGAYLIPDRMARPEERLELSHVIESMAKLPPEKQKILVLEAVQAPSNWRLGMLHNDFARRLEDLEPEIRDDQEPLGPECVRRRPAVLDLGRAGANRVQPLHDRGLAGEGRRLRRSTDAR